MWSQRSILFATLQVVGSDNNLRRNAENDREYEARNRANFNWLRTVFSVARDVAFAGLVIATRSTPTCRVLACGWRNRRSRHLLPL